MRLGLALARWPLVSWAAQTPPPAPSSSHAPALPRPAPPSAASAASRRPSTLISAPRPAPPRPSLPTPPPTPTPHTPPHHPAPPTPPSSAGAASFGLALANVAAASRREDELGLLQNAGSLPQVISSLVACRQAADGHASRVAASGAALRQQVVEGGTPAADLKALLMELDLSLYKIAAEFGPHISKIPLPKPVATELEAFARFEK
eukprot:tig00000607_g2524.t1